MPDILNALSHTPTARQEAFAQNYAKFRSPSRAYREAYEALDMDVYDASKRGRSVMKSPVVMQRIEELIAASADSVVFTVGEALARWLAIASADPNELVSLKIGACRYCHGEAHGYHWRLREYLERCDQAEAAQTPLPIVGGGFGYDATRDPHPDCPECHGEGLQRVVPKDTESLSPGGRLLFCGVKVTAHGTQILMADQMKALENACRIIGAFKDDAGAKISVDARRMVQNISLESTDPQAAARAYMELIQHREPHTAKS